jgi:hypothetical protein
MTPWRACVWSCALLGCTLQARPLAPKDVKVDATVAKSEFCRGDTETDLLWLTLRVRISNAGSSTLLGPELPRLGVVEVARSLEALAAGDLEMSINVDEIGAGAVARPQASDLRALRPGTSFTIEEKVFVVVSRPGKVLPGVLSTGSHVLRTTVIPLAGKRNHEVLQREVGGRGVLWTDAIPTPGVPFTIPNERVYGSCRFP